jgi:hypothetical protein
MVNFCEFSIPSQTSDIFLPTLDISTPFTETCYFNIGLYTQYLLGLMLSLFFLYKEFNILETDLEFIHTLKIKLSNLFK